MNSIVTMILVEGKEGKSPIENTSTAPSVTAKESVVTGRLYLHRTKS